MTRINNYEDYKPEFGKFRLLYHSDDYELNAYYFHKHEIVRAYKIISLLGIDNFRNLTEVNGFGGWCIDMPITQLCFSEFLDAKTLILDFYEKIKHVAD